MFRYKKSLRLSEERQGYIYYTSLAYKNLTAAQKRRIRELCRECGGEYCEALLEFVTTDYGAVAICTRHHLSKSTLYRIVREYYRNFPKTL